MVMAASAAMIFAATSAPRGRARDAGQAPPPPSSSLVLLNQIQDLQAQMRQMQGQIEVLQHQLHQLEQTSKDQYVDLDSRMGKLEHSQPGAAASTAPAPSASAAVPPAASASVARPMSAADKAAAQTAYDAAFKALRDGNYVDSARSFRAFIDTYPQSTLVSNAYYWLGGSYYVTQNYKPALAAFQTLLRDYPDSPKAAEAQLRVADCQIALKDYAAARLTLQAAIKANPGTTVEKRAREKLQDMPAQTGTP
jgi:tol-pal system protein YbgF